jgi:phenylacetaldehyde dehydrogenase
MTAQPIEDTVRLPETRLYIDGQWVDSMSGETFATVNPANGEVIAKVPSGNAEDVDRAVRAARRALESGPWSVAPPLARAKALYRIADLIEQRGDQLAALESLDNGKPVSHAKMVDIPSAANVFRYMAGWASKAEGSQIPLAGRPQKQFLAYTTRDPVGVVGQIVPWNFPLLMAAWKVAPALAFGCASILKPAEQTPLTALALAEIVNEAGVPPGHLNVITGFGHSAGAPLVTHRDIDKIAFTGSTEVGKQIARIGVDSLKRISLELGGKSPIIILADADVNAAAQGAAHAIFFNQGQVCTAGSRLYVHASIYDEVMERLVKIAEGLKMGHGLDPATQIGPLVSEEQLKRVAEYVRIGRKEGASVVTGGESVDRPGYFFKPTILADIKQSMRVVQEEIFGPVLVATRFHDINEVADLANDTEFGLAASVWTRDVSLAHTVARAIKAGTVWVNCHHVMDSALPFGGFKQSGWGREMGAAAMEMYTESKSICIQL